MGSRRLAGDDLERQRPQAFAPERQVAREQQVGQNGESELVRPAIQGTPFDLLRAHEARGAGHHTLGALRRKGPRQAEVRYLDLIVAERDEDVTRLDVAMDDLGCVGRVERGGDLAEHGEGPIHRCWSSRLQAGIERTARHELHDDIQELLMLPNLVDGNDVRVGQIARQPSFFEQGLFERGLFRTVEQVDLNGLEGHFAADG